MAGVAARGGWVQCPRLCSPCPSPPPLRVPRLPPGNTHAHPARPCHATRQDTDTPCMSPCSSPFPPSDHARAAQRGRPAAPPHAAAVPCTGSGGAGEGEGRGAKACWARRDRLHGIKQAGQGCLPTSAANRSSAQAPADPPSPLPLLTCRCASGWAWPAGRASGAAGGACHLGVPGALPAAAAPPAGRWVGGGSTLGWGCVEHVVSACGTGQRSAVPSP